MAIEGRELENRQVKAKIMQYYNYPKKLNRIKPKILIHHKKIIKQILKSKENGQTIEKKSDVQLKLFSEILN